MDTRIAAHGLNVTSASRVFFLNPPWHRSVERQAIKRAHRIGQTRAVYVETVVLSGTIEEDMLLRREEMRGREGEGVKRFWEDGKLRGVVSGARFVPPVKEGDTREEGQEGDETGGLEEGDTGGGLGEWGRVFKVKGDDEEVDRVLEIMEKEEKGRKRKVQIQLTDVLDGMADGEVVVVREERKRKLRFEDAEDEDEIPKRTKTVVLEIPRKRTAMKDHARVY